MYQTDNIIDKAKRLGLDTGNSSNSADNLRKIASQVGMDDFNSITDVDKLEKILDDKLKDQNNDSNDNVNVSQDNIENLNDYAQENPYYNNGYSNERQPFGKDAYDATKGEHGHDKDYYKNQNDDLKKKKEEAEKAKEEADEKKKEAASKKEAAKGTDGNKEANKEYKGAKKAARRANKDLKSANQNLRANRVNDFKNSFYRTTHPGEVAKDAVKDKAKEVASNAGKKVANAAGNAAKAGAKAAGQAAKAGVQAAGHAIAAFVAANPWILAVVAVLVLVLLILLLIMATGDVENEYYGYYAPSCDITLYNESDAVSITYDYGYTIEDDSYTLKELVVAQAYYHLDYIYNSVGAEDFKYDDEIVEAMLIIIQTNVLLSSFQDESAEEDSERIVYAMPEYMEDVMAVLGSGSFDEELYNNISNLYDNVESNMYVQSDYDTTYLNNLLDKNSLSSDSYLYFPTIYVKDILDWLQDNETSSVEEILDKYNEKYLTTGDYYLFSVEEDCDYYTLTDNTAYWWPIGSSTATDTVNGVDIYGGTPTLTNISSPYGERDLGSGFHYSIDIDYKNATVSKEEGAIVIASQAGTVIAVNDGCADESAYDAHTCNSDLGNYVKIKHDDGVTTIYGHLKLNSITVEEGDTVLQGQKLGIVGSSGQATGYHLHFAVEVNGEKTDPEDYVSSDNPRPVVSSSSTTYVSGSTNKQSICLTLKNSYDNTAVTALMVNIFAESGYKTTDIGDSGTSYGLFQWHESRYEQLEEYCGDDIDTIECQLNFLEYELTNKYPEIKKYLSSSTYTAYKKTVYFCEKFERPANATTVCASRANNYVESIYTYVQNGCSE